MTAPKSIFMNALVLFWWPEPKWLRPCVYCYEGCKELKGRVVAVSDLQTVGPGKVPDYELTVKGSSTGKELLVSVVKNFVQILSDD